ncbi:hypothetical protein B0O80DRAFT_431970 [Mortierella sp. GBAus27b]|nr:hypothetical protein BGX31_005000 [Mortierella sp. GBA43]KAI8344974.1 hypothetical protein B0O80DRAFT_431970 [Mortierella sp. GBAus27b]
MEANFIAAFNSVFTQLTNEVLPQLGSNQSFFIDTTRLESLVRQRITPGTAQAPGVTMVLDAELRSCIVNLNSTNVPTQASGLNELVPAGTVSLIFPSDGSHGGKKYPEGIKLKNNDPQTAARGAGNRVFTYDVALAKQLTPFF